MREVAICLDGSLDSFNALAGALAGTAEYPDAILRLAAADGFPTKARSLPEPKISGPFPLESDNGMFTQTGQPQQVPQRRYQ